MRIVLVRLSALGDIVHTWPLAEAIRSALPRAHLTWVVEEPFKPLVEGHPAVDSVFTATTKRWRRRPLSARTRAEIALLKTRFEELSPDLAIDAQGTLKSAVVTRWTGAPRRVGLARPWRRELMAGLPLTETLPGSRDHRHVVATNLALVRAVGGEPPTRPTPPDGRWLSDRASGTSIASTWKTPYAVILPGAGRPEKILPVETLADSARHLVSRGLDVVVAWGPAEGDRARAIAGRDDARIHLAPPTDLLELTAVLGAAVLVVGGDTGPVHLAASLGVPTIAIHLTTDPLRNGPLGDRTTFVSAALPGRGHRGSATTGRARSVTTEEIETAVAGMLRSQV